MAEKIGDIIDALDKVKERKKELKALLSDENDRQEELEGKLIAALDEQGLPFAGGASCGKQATITEDEFPNVTSWDEVYQWMMENNAPYALEKRIVASIWREMRDAGEMMPGTVVATKRGISLVKAAKSKLRT